MSSKLASETMAFLGRRWKNTAPPPMKGSKYRSKWRGMKLEIRGISCDFPPAFLTNGFFRVNLDANITTSKLGIQRRNVARYLSIDSCVRRLPRIEPSGKA